jgi:serine/threonine-protein kinase
LSAEEKISLIGRTIAGKFAVERLLGAGAMGEVYVAEQTVLGKKIAIKVLHRHLAGEPGMAKRFHREARAASVLEHPNCIQVIDFGEDAGFLYIAMELLSGRDLLKVIKTESPLSLGRIGRIMSQILGALDEAHAKGVVHRDLKPENVMISDLRGERDHVKVCDFGIAKLTSERESASAITVAGMVCGTPEYMSPEQARGEEIDGRSDLYAAGCILYQMVVGEPPFRAGSALGVVTKQLMEMPEPPSKRRPDVKIDPGLEALILKTLEKDREKRPKSAAEMQAALEAIAPVTFELRSGSTSSPAIDASSFGSARTEEALPTPPPVVGTGPTAPAIPTPVPQAASSSTPSASGLSGELLATAPKKSGRGLWLGIVAAVMVVGGGGGALIMMRKSNPPPLVATTVTPPPPAPNLAPPSSPTLPPAPPPPWNAPNPSPSAPVVAPSPAPPVVAVHEEHHHHSSSKSVKPVAAAPVAPAPAPAPTVAPPAPHGYAALFGEAKELFSNGDYEKAAARYEEAAHLQPDTAVVHRELGKCYTRLGKQDRAQKEYRRYLELAPNASDAKFYQNIVGQ